MRENDDDAPATGPEGSLADGVGETMDQGDHASSGDPYGDVDFDDSYGEDTADTSDTSGDGTDDTDGTGAGDDPYGTDDTYDTDGTYGDGDGADDAGSADDVPADEPDTTTDGGVSDDEAFVAQDGSPLEGIGFLLDEVREALFGDDDAAAATPFDTDPVDLETETDLDLTGDGLVDSADLHEAASSLDFHVGDGHHGHHDDGVMDA